MRWTAVKQTTLYNGFLELQAIDLKHELYAGGESPVLRRELLSHGDVSAVLPYDPVRDELVLIEQFRIGSKDREGGPWVTEVIAGYQDSGETPEDVARRECREEADCRVTELWQMMRYYSSPGMSTERIYLYLARTSTESVGGIHGLDHEGEDIRVHVVSPLTAFEWLGNGRIDSAMPVIAVQWFQQHYDEIRRAWLA
ncbi:MAG: NUDIX domain-containing protein [Gammaproteobacteria bacterium]|nr:NUDIX domain-containing protein [Gammaproteobacteria bacterium]